MPSVPEPPARDNLVHNLFTPGPALYETLPCPPDANGIRWRSRISHVLSARARETGRDDLAVLQDFIAAVGERAIDVARIEAGRTPPSPDYRARAAVVLGVPVGDLFARHDDADDAGQGNRIGREEARP